MCFQLAIVHHGDILVITNRTEAVSSDRFFVREPFDVFFPRSEFAGYDAFVGAQGKCLKSEPRTQIVLLERPSPNGLNEDAEWFVVKEYYYPLLPRLRTWLRHSKAEHEFKSLLEVQRLGVVAAEPVAFGSRRTLVGFVRSCFIITRYVDNCCTVEQWFKEGEQLDKTHAERNWSVCNALGKTFRMLHQGDLFLFTAKPRNILLRRTSNIPEIIVIDIPYALRISIRFLARRSQAFDLAVLLGNIERISSEEPTTSFYSSYLPDPLGAPRETLERRMARAIRWRRNQTPLSSLVHSVRRAGKKRQREQRKQAASFRGTLRSFLALFELSHILELSDLKKAISLLDMMP